MHFGSVHFLVWFLPLFLLVHAVVPRAWKHPLTLLGSLLFYAWGAPRFVVVLVLSSLLDHWIALRLKPGTRPMLWLGVGLNLLCLFVFKYFNFFIENAAQIAEAVGFSFPAYMHFALPLGISFFTFQKISYLVDVYRGHTEPADSYGEYLLYVSFFPQLIAGPIVRFTELAPQLRDVGEQVDMSLRLAGFQRFALGLVKKVLIADTLGRLADQAFVTDELGALYALTGLLAYTFQIYFDFSAYSDMAIGLGMMLGVKLPENFHWPYAAVGFRSFWRKWHITLSRWLRDHLYVPLGGNRAGTVRTLFNLWFVFLISGLWHGAEWTFVIWGMWHGAFILVDRRTRFFQGPNPWAGGILTFTLVMLGWVWFRAPDVGSAIHYFGELLNADLNQQFEVSGRQWATLAVAICFSFLPPDLHDAARHYHGDDGKRMLTKTVVSIVFLLLCLGQLGIEKAMPFVYFRF